MYAGDETLAADDDAFGPFGDDDPYEPCLTCGEPVPASCNGMCDECRNDLAADDLTSREKTPCWCHAFEWPSRQGRVHDHDLCDGAGNRLDMEVSNT